MILMNRQLLILRIFCLLLLFILFGMLGFCCLRTLNPDEVAAYPVPQIDCVSYTPFFHFSHFNYNDTNRKIKPEWVEKDLKTLSSYTHCIRIYTTLFGMDIVPSIAARYHINVIAGAEISDDPDITRQDIDGLVQMANTYPNVIKILVGNEVLTISEMKLRGVNVSPEELYYIIDSVKAKVKKPVSSAETSYQWYNHPELIKHVDFIAAHIFPYWDGVRAEDALASTLKTYNILHSSYPNKPIFIAETGWPSIGTSVKNAVPDKWASYQFLRDIWQRSQSEHFSYVIIEAFDQPWKENFHEGKVGGHWGIFDIHDKSKFTEPTILIGKIDFTYLEVEAFIFSFLLFVLWTDIHNPITLWTAIVTPLLSYCIGYGLAEWVEAIREEYIYLYIYSIYLVVPTAIILLINLIHLIQTTLEVMSNKPLKRNLESLNIQEAIPFISIHIACSNEDPKHVIECVNSLLAQEYERFEIILVDNNTANESLWRPLDALYGQNNSHVKFFHIEKMEGFKAGALSFALEHTSSEATVIGVVDADYVVNPHWLKECSKYLGGKIKAVQAPQDYSSDMTSLFQRATYDEYAGFFKIGMVQRNEHNAIIQHGTMILLDRDAVMKVGGWHTDSIVEDTDLGVRLLIAGYEAVYINCNYGKGRLPVNFNEYCKQRFRWSYGAVRVLIKYAKYFFSPFHKELSFVQKKSFLLGWLPWIGDIFHPMLVVIALVLSAYCAVSDRYVLTEAIFTPIIYYAIINGICSFLLYRKRLKISAIRILYSLISGSSLIWTIAHGVFTGVFYRNYPFKITRKGNEIATKRQNKTLRHLFSSAAFLTSIIMLYFAGYFLYSIDHITFDLKIWIILLIVIATPGISCGLMIVFERCSLKDGASLARLFSILRSYKISLSLD